MNAWRKRLCFPLAALAALSLAPPHGPVGAAATAVAQAEALRPASIAAATRAATARRSRPTAGRTNVDCFGKAIGGLENIARISTLYTRYEVQYGGRKGVDIHWRHASGALRESLDVPGAVSELTVFDGTRGFRRGTDGAVLPLSGVALGEVVTDAYLGSYMHLVPGRIPGKVERLGLDRASGLVKLRIQPEGGAPVTLFLDTLTCLPARIEQPSGAGKHIFHLREWRAVGDIKLPHAIRRATGDTAKDARYTLVEARFDAPLRAGIFAKPAPAVSQPVTTGETR